ncbi:hypothetical protein ACWFRF_29130 [Nocardia sp. NPDC055165]
MLTHLGQAHTTWGLAPIILTATVLIPITLFALLVSLAAVVAVFGNNRSSARAMRIFDATLGALISLMNAILRTGSDDQPRRAARKVRRGRR